MNLHRAGALALAAVLTAAAPAWAQDPAAVEAATEAYARLNAGDAPAAIVAARRAVAAAPDNLDYRLLLTDALLREQRNDQALTALQPVAGLADYRVQSRLAQAAAAAGRREDAAKAYGAAAPLAPDADARAYLTRAQVMTLLELDRRAEARAVFDAAWSAGVLRNGSPLNTAMLAIAVGDDAAAQDAFADAERTAPLAGRAALDAGYSARRLGRDADAARYLQQGLASFPVADPDMTAQRRFEIEREVETLQRRWGASASVSHGVASTDAFASASTGAENVTQAGGEAWYRVGGYNDGRPFDVFVRAFGTLDADQGGATGGDTVQGWIGARWKPLSQANLVLEASKMIALGDLARDDVMLRAAWSTDYGTDLRFDRSSWPSGRLYVDVAHILDDEQTLGIAEARAGWTWRLDDRSTLTPAMRVQGYYDNLLADSTAVVVGPGLSWRRWFRDGDYSAPASSIEFTVGYDFSLDETNRGSGLSALINLAY